MCSHWLISFLLPLLRESFAWGYFILKWFQILISSPNWQRKWTKRTQAKCRLLFVCFFLQSHVEIKLNLALWICERLTSFSIADTQSDLTTIITRWLTSAVSLPLSFSLSHSFLLLLSISLQYNPTPDHLYCLEKKNRNSFL